jgi:hypothetical protein
MTIEIALTHAAAGFHVFPVSRTKSTLTAHGFKDATRNPEVIRQWWTKWPEANPALHPGRSGQSVLDIDHGLTDEASFHAWRERNGVPRTYTVRSGSRPEFKVHMYFDGSLSDVGVWELDGCSGQIKSLGGYVLAAGSVALHGANHDKPGEPYSVLDGELGHFAPVPDVIRGLHKPVATPSGNAKVPKTRWNLPVHDGENRTGFLLEQCGQLRNLGCGFDAIFAHMAELNEDQEIIANPLDSERLQRTAENCAKYEVPASAPRVVIGGRTEQPEAAPLRESNRAIYPIEVWDATVLGEFAKLCADDNHIPRKMYAEAFRCCLGAVVGDRIECPIEGALPRSYTIIIAPKGKGKGTAIRRAVRFFSQEWYGTATSPGLLSGARDFIWKPQGIGAWLTAASSVPGMARLTNDLKKTIKNAPHLTWSNTLPRVLSCHEEMKTFLSTLFIEGGVGSGMEGVVCQLWDDVSFNGTATGTREAVYGEMLFSLLAGVTSEDWFDILSRGNAVGGGLMSRFNLIGTEGEYKNVGKMTPPDLTSLQESFMPRIRLLADARSRVLPMEGAEKIIGEWSDALPEGTERMNVHAWRSALMLAWLRREEAITPKTAEDAVRLGQYQVDSHDYYRTKAAETQNAKVQEKQLRALRLRGSQSRRDLQRITHAERYGTEVWNRALDGLLKDKSVGKRGDGAYYLAKD